MLNDLPLLSLMILSLPFGAALIWLIPDARKARLVGLLVALVDLVFAVGVLLRFDSNEGGFQLLERYEWIPGLNIHYQVGVDGISVLFLPLTVVLFLGVIIASWKQVRVMPRLFYTLLLLLESATLGIFCALDTVLFLFFWELSLIPLYFLISLWGIGPNRRYAAVKYTLFMLLGGVPILFGFVVLAFNHAEVAGVLSFDYLQLLNTPVPMRTQKIVFILLLLGFAAKIPAVPLHTWLPLVSMEGPVAVAALLTGLKLGVYGLIRFAVPLAPDAAQDLHWLLAGIGTVGLLYGAMAALAQTNLRRMLAFLSISHVGMVVLSVSSLNMAGIQGAVFQLLNFTVISGGLFLIAGFLYHRSGSTDIAHLGGVARTMPLLAWFFLLFGFASIGLPGTNGFPAEFLIIISALQTHTGAGLAVLFSIIIAAAYLLRIFRLTFLGPSQQADAFAGQDLRPRELIVVGVFALLILVGGLYPAGVLDLSREASQQWVERVSTKVPLQQIPADQVITKHQRP